MRPAVYLHGPEHLSGLAQPLVARQRKSEFRLTPMHAWPLSPLSHRALRPRVRLADLGLLETDLDRAAQIATEKPYWNPRDITKDAILRILQQAWAGEPPERT